MSERKSWSVTDEEVHRELAAMLDLSDDEKAILASLEGAAKAASAGVAKAFYERLMVRENTAEYFAGQDMEARHATVATWFEELFTGRYDDTYAAKRLEIGAVHVRIGLPVRYPLAMMDLILEQGEKLASTHERPEEAQRAFRKVFALDVAIFNHAYEHNQLRHLAQLVGGERLARRLLTGET